MAPTNNAAPRLVPWREDGARSSSTRDDTANPADLQSRTLPTPAAPLMPHAATHAANSGGRHGAAAAQLDDLGDRGHWHRTASVDGPNEATTEAPRNDERSRSDIFRTRLHGRPHHLRISRVAERLVGGDEISTTASSSARGVARSTMGEKGTTIRQRRPPRGRRPTSTQQPRATGSRACRGSSAARWRSAPGGHLRKAAPSSRWRSWRRVGCRRRPRSSTRG